MLLKRVLQARTCNRNSVQDEKTDFVQYWGRPIDGMVGVNLNGGKLGWNC